MATNGQVRNDSRAPYIKRGIKTVWKRRLCNKCYWHRWLQFLKNSWMLTLR